jgi:Tol biopolymer transport system component
MNPSPSRDSSRVAFEAVDMRTQLSRVPLQMRGPFAEPTRIPTHVRVAYGAISHSGTSLAVNTDRAGRWALWKMPAEGGSAEPLREGTGHEEDPSWSPDDRRIALSHVEGPSRRVAVMSASGGPLTYVSEPELFARDPSWSADGRSIAFISIHGGSSLRIASPDGGPTRSPVSHPLRMRRPSWSPDGRRLVVGAEQPGGRWGLAFVALERPEVQLVMSDARAPLWLPDGRIVFVRRNTAGGWGFWIVPLGADGLPIAARAEPVTTLPAGTDVDVDLPASSDGRYLYFILRERVMNDVWLARVP